MTAPKNILIFEPDASGHHSGYLYHLINNFLQNDYSYQLIVLVSPDFFEKHPQILQKTTSPRVHWIKFSDDEYTQWQSPKSVFKRSIFEWKLCCQYAKQYNAILAFFMYIDYLQLAILSQSPPPCPISGILFRSTLVNYPATSWKEKLNYWRKNITLKYFVKNKSVNALFNLDVYATKFIEQNWHTKKVKFLPDPVQIYPSQRTPADIKKTLGIEENRKVFLIFGYLDSRKGISEVMEAIAVFPKKKSQKACLLLVGSWEENERKLFEIQLPEIKQNTDFQIIIKDTFIKDNDIQPYFEASDFALALYHNHFGMSAIMVRAAVAQKPLLTYNFGLMGKIVAEHELGITINHDLKEKMEMLLETDKSIGNKDKMKAFAELNQAKNYAKVILEYFREVSS